MNFSLTNNIRFYDTTKEADFDTYFPNFDNQLLREQYYTDRNPLEYYREHIINKEIQFQIRNDELITVDVYIDGDIEDTGATVADITPENWVGDSIYLVSYTPSAEGIYQFKIADTDFESDEVNVITTSKKIVKVEYSNDTNDYGTIFVDDSLESVYTGLAYFTGYLKAGDSKMEKEVFKTDRGVQVTQRSTPIDQLILYIEGIHETYLQYISKIFSCNSLKVNDIFVNSDGEISKEQIPESDCFNLTITLVKTDITYLV
jgi:hypothetical protein